MTTRQTIPTVEGKSQLETGYDTSGNDPSDFYIPSCGLKDVDTSMVELFDKQIIFKPIQTNMGVQKEINTKKPLVIFALGERFALAKRLKPFRDRNGILLLPAISIRRTDLEQQNNDVFFGELKIKRRLDQSDKDYQNLINKFLLKNVENPPDTYRTNKGIDRNLPSIKQGMLLDNKNDRLKDNHIYETIVIPFPQFFTATYEVTFWTTSMNEMNNMIETLFTNQITPGKGFYLKTDKGYWFNATVDSAMKPQDNFEDITEAERLVKYSFNISVRGFLLAPQANGQRVPFKRYLSNVNFSFETVFAEGTITDQKNKDNFEESKNDFTKENKFILSDLEQDPVEKQKPDDNEKYIFTREYVDENGIKRTKHIKQMSNNQKQGETVYTASDQETLMKFFIDNKKDF